MDVKWRVKWLLWKTTHQVLRQSDHGKTLIWRNVSCLLRHIELFRILLLCCKLPFMLIVAIVIELTFVALQQPRNCLLVYCWGNRESRGFGYPVATPGFYLHHLVCVKSFCLLYKLTISWFKCFKLYFVCFGTKFKFLF